VLLKMAFKSSAVVAILATGSQIIHGSATASLRGGGNETRRLASVDLTSGGFTASTTNFGFGSTTACGCSNPDTLVKNLAELGWYGAASTVWQGSPYKGTGDSWSCGACEGGTCNDAISNNWGSQSFNNCASGSSGCMTCWELTVADEPNIYGAKLAAAGKKANVVVVDNCEMNNQYGNNQQWCVPFKNVPSEGCVITGTCQPTSCQSGETLDEEAGSWSDDGAWQFGACGSASSFDCLNAAGRPAHFDLALDVLPASSRPWDTGDNPVVTASPITCPAEVLNEFKGTCSDAFCSYS